MSDQHSEVSMAVTVKVTDTLDAPQEVPGRVPQKGRDPFTLTRETVGGPPVEPKLTTANTNIRVRTVHGGHECVVKAITIYVSN